MGVNLEHQADFSKIRSQNDLMIDEIIHKTFLKVNEEGTEAAAVTIAEIMQTSMAPMPELIYYMNIDRPYSSLEMINYLKIMILFLFLKLRKLTR